MILENTQEIASLTENASQQEQWLLCLEEEQAKMLAELAKTQTH